MSSEHRSVLVVDDSALVRRIIVDLLEGSDEFRVAGTAADGMEAIRQVHALQPDLVTLDVQMPVLGGLETLGYIMSETPRPVVILSALDSPQGGDLTMRALELGAVDFVRKPGRDESLDQGTLAERLLTALRTASRVNLRAAPVLARPSARSKASSIVLAPARRVVAIAASTGGPRALAEIIPMLRADLGAAVIIAQHMPPGFTRSLAQRLDRLSAIPVREGWDGEVLLENRVVVAPGGRHVVVERHGAVLRLAVQDGGPPGPVRPSADRLFASVAKAVGPNAVGVVLTGMGRDGSLGLHELRQAGAYGIVQDRQSSTVFGMPMMAYEIAGADRVASLHGIADAIAEGVLSLVTRDRAPGEHVTTTPELLS